MIGRIFYVLSNEGSGNCNVSAHTPPHLSPTCENITQVSLPSACLLLSHNPVPSQAPNHPLASPSARYSLKPGARPDPPPPPASRPQTMSTSAPPAASSTASPRCPSPTRATPTSSAAARRPNNESVGAAPRRAAAAAAAAVPLPLPLPRCTGRTPHGRPRAARRRSRPRRAAPAAARELTGPDARRALGTAGAEGGSGEEPPRARVRRAGSAAALRDAWAGEAHTRWREAYGDGWGAVIRVTPITVR